MLSASSRFISLILLASVASPAWTAEYRSTPGNRLRDLLQQAVDDQRSFKDRFDAQVWLLDMSNRLRQFIDDDQLRIQLLKNVHYEANRARLHPELVLALIEVESRFDEFAISVSGARGLMQIMPFWLNEIELPNKNLFHIPTNLRMGCTILKHYIELEKGDLTKALARYNGSQGKAAYPNKVFEALNRTWFRQ